MAEWIVGGEPSLDPPRRMDVGATIAPRATRSPWGARGSLRSPHDIARPNDERQAGPPLRLSPPAYGWHAAHGACFGESLGWERVNWYESTQQAGATAVRRAAGLGATGRRRSPPSTPPAARRRPRRLRRDLLREDRGGTGRGAASFLEKLCDNPGSRATFGPPPTPTMSRRGGIEGDFTGPGGPGDRFGSSPACRFGATTWPGSARTACDEAVTCVSHDVTSRWACMGLWVRRRARSWPGRTSAISTSPTCRCASCGRRRAGGGAARDLRRRARGGALTAHEFGAAVRRCGRPGGSRTVAGGYRAIDCGGSRRLPRLGRRHHPRRRGGRLLGFCVKLEKGDFIGREALLAAASAAWSGVCARLVLDDARRSATSR